jgi:hypothetical protein
MITFEPTTGLRVFEPAPKPPLPPSPATARLPARTDWERVTEPPVRSPRIAPPKA